MTLKRVFSWVLVCVLTVIPVCSATAMEDKSLEELWQIIAEAESAIEENYTVSYDTSKRLCALVKEEIEARYTGSQVEWPWFDWEYRRNREDLSVLTRIRVSKDGISDRYDVEVMYHEEDATLTLSYLRVGTNVLLDERALYAAAQDQTEVGTDAKKSTDVENYAPTVAEPVEPDAADMSEPEPIVANDAPTDAPKAALPEIEDAQSAEPTDLWVVAPTEDVGTPLSDIEGKTVGMQMDEMMPEPTAMPTPEPTAMPTPEPTAAPTPIPDDRNTIMQSGDKSEAVKQLQALLVRTGYLDGTPDGAFGPKTYNAVCAFEKSLGREETGKVTMYLLAQLTEEAGGAQAAPVDTEQIVCQKGDNNASVTQVQTMLKKLNLFDEAITAFYGDVTMASVTAFQERNGLAPTGVVTRETYDKLVALTKKSSITTFTLFKLLYNNTLVMSYSTQLLPDDMGTRDAQGKLTWQIDAYATLEMLIDDQDNLVSAALTGKNDTSAQALTTIKSGMIALLAATGIKNTPKESEEFLNAQGILKDGGFGTFAYGEVEESDVVCAWVSDGTDLRLSVGVA